MRDPAAGEHHVRRTLGVVAIVRYWAGARAAAGCAEEQLGVSSVGELLSAVAQRHDIDRILQVSSLLIDGVAVRTSDSARHVPVSAVVDVLPPFAGG